MVTLYTIVLLILFVLVPWGLARLIWKIVNEKPGKWYQDWFYGVGFICCLALIYLALYGVWSAAHYLAETFINEHNIH